MDDGKTRRMRISWLLGLWLSVGALTPGCLAGPPVDGEVPVDEDALAYVEPSFDDADEVDDFEEQALKGPKGLDISENLALGIPDDSRVGDLRKWLIVRKQLATSYDTAMKAPRWSSWTLSASDLGNVSRATSFSADPELPKDAPQATDNDFRKSGYDRGHLCPSADRTKNETDNRATFYFTNVVPQAPGSNSGAWLDFEFSTRAKAKKGMNLALIAGPIFATNNPTVGDDVAVPVAMFKVAVVMDGALDPKAVTSKTQVYAAIIPNDASATDTDWRKFQVTVRDVEAQTGLELLADVPKRVQNVIEKRIDP